MMDDILDYLSNKQIFIIYGSLSLLLILVFILPNLETFLEILKQ